VKRYLAIPGALLLTAAFIRSAVNLEWDATSVALAIAGGAVVTVAAAWNRRDVIEWLRDPRGVFAVTTGIAVALFVAALVMLNIVVWYNPWSVDLTASGRNEVTAETRAILARLDEPVVLRQFGPTPLTDQLLRSFARESRLLRVEVADVERDRQQTLEYGIGRSGTVVVVAGNTFRKVEEPNEQALITAIVQATSDVQRTVCFVTGRGERGLQDTGAGGLNTLRAILEGSNYEPQAISLLEGDVPAECAAVVVAGARQGYTPDEISRLAKSADSRGRIAILLEPDPAPSFAGIIGPRGIEPGAGRILDASGAGSGLGLGPTAPFAIVYPDHPVTRGFGAATFYEGARPLRVHDRPEHGGKPSRLAETSPRSFATAREESIIGFDESTDQRGPLTLAAAVAFKTGRSGEDEARIAVFGDSDFIANSGIRFSNNREFFLRTLAWLLGEQEATFVSVANRENRRILLPQRTLVWMYVVNLGLLPLIPLIAGVVVYVRSRR
jgi:hypothetical protein